MMKKFKSSILIILFVFSFTFNCAKDKLNDSSDVAFLSVLQRLSSLLPTYSTASESNTNTLTLSIAVASSSTIELMWNELDSAVNYRVYRDTTTGFTPSTSNEVVSTSTSITLKGQRADLVTPLNSSVTSAKNTSGLTSGTKYFYKISAITANGTVIYSNEVSATPASGFSVRSHAGSGVPGNMNGDGYNSSFNFPQGLSVDASGFIYLADSGNQSIRRISPRIGDVVNAGVAAYAIEGQATTFAGTGSWGNANSSVPSTASFFDPWSTCVDTGTGNIYVADSTNHSIRQITIAGVVSTLAGANTASSGSGTTDATGAAARFNYPQAITCDGTNIFVADTYNNAIRKVVIGSGAVTILAGTVGQAGQGSVDGTGTAAKFYLPRGITVEGTTNLYVSDSGNHTIRKIVIATGVVTTVAGTAGTQGKADGTGTAATFAFPRGIAFSSANSNLYVADSSNHVIRKITSAGVVTTIAGSGSPGNQDGFGNYASFRFPQGVAYTATTAGGCPCLYISDSDNHKIRRISGAL